MHNVQVRETLDSWEKECKETLTDIFLAYETEFTYVEKIEDALDRLSGIFNKLAISLNAQLYSKKNINIEHEFFLSVNEISGLAICMLERVLSPDEIEYMLLDIYSLLLSKQRDYGPENIKKFGIVGIIIRLFDKIARLDNISARYQNFYDAVHANSVKNESLVDTLQDIIGYCTIGLMVYNGTFDAEMEMI